MDIDVVRCKKMLRYNKIHEDMKKWRNLIYEDIMQKKKYKCHCIMQKNSTLGVFTVAYIVVWIIITIIIIMR